MHDYDVFISHASEDKGALVRPLAEALHAAGLRVWYDEHTLKLGDNLRRSIDHGLASARYGIVILSSAFLRKGWTNWELDGLVQRQVGGENVILPVWHGVTTSEMQGYSPSLANLVAANTKDGLPSLIRQILEIVRPMPMAGAASTALLSDEGTSQAMAAQVFVHARSRHTDTVPVDDLIFELERQLASSDGGISAKQLIIETPMILTDLGRSWRAVIETHPRALEKFGIDAVVVSQPQGLFVNLLWIESPSLAFFEPDGAWSDTLARIVGSLVALKQSPEFDALKSLACDLANAAGESFYDIFHHSSQGEVRQRFTNGQFQIRCIALCGRLQSINEEWRQAFNEHASHRPFIELRTYDYVLEELYHYCQRAKIDEPLVLTTFLPDHNAETFFTLTSSMIAQCEPELRARVAAQLPTNADIRIISVQLTMQSRNPLPSEEHTHYAEPSAFKLAICDDVPYEWKALRKMWSAASSYHREISLAKLGNAAISFLYQLNDASAGVELELVISGVSFSILPE